MTSLINEQPDPKQQQLCVISIKKSLNQYFQKALMRWQSMQHKKHAFNYITYFHFNVPGAQIVKLNWIIQVQPDNMTVLVSYVQCNGCINFLSVNDERMSQQISFLLKNVNRSKNHQFTYLITQQRIIALRYACRISQLKRIVHTQLKGIFKLIHQQVSARFGCFIPFLVLHSTFLRQMFGSYDIYQRQQIAKTSQMEFIDRLQYLKKKFEQSRRHRKEVFDLYNLQYSKQLCKMSQLSNLIANDMISFNSILRSFNTKKISYDNQKANTDYNLGQRQQDTIVSGIRILSQEKAQRENNRGGNGAISFQFVKFQLLNTVNEYTHTARSETKMNVHKIQNAIASKQKKTNYHSTQKSFEISEGEIYYSIIGQKAVPIIQAHLAKKIPMEQSQTAVNSFQNQLALLNYIRGEKCGSIGKYFIQPQSKRKIYMETYSQNFSQFLQKNIKMTISSKLKLALKITQGVWFLHSKSICHRDLKPQNIMIEQSNGWNPKIIDFGSICVSTDKFEPFKVPQQRLLSTKGYHIPYQQVTQQLRKIYSKFEYQKHQYFDSYSLGRIFQKIFRTHKEFQLQNYKQNIIKEYLEFIIGNCLDPNPMNRLSAEQIYRFIQILIEIDQACTNISSMSQGKN